MKTTKTKPIWSLEQWTDYATRVRALEDRISDYIKAFPETRGLTTRHLNAIIRIHHKLHPVLCIVENLITLQCPECDNPYRIAFGNRRGAWGLCRGRVKAIVGVLSKAQWVELGREMKWFLTECHALGDELQRTRYATKVMLGRFTKVDSAIGHAKCVLDDLVCRQYPDWEQFTHVFYGPTDPLS